MDLVKKIKTKHTFLAFCQKKCLQKNAKLAHFFHPKVFHVTVAEEDKAVFFFLILAFFYLILFLFSQFFSFHILITKLKKRERLQKNMSALVI